MMEERLRKGSCKTLRAGMFFGGLAIAVHAGEVEGHHLVRKMFCEVDVRSNATHLSLGTFVTKKVKTSLQHRHSVHWEEPPFQLPLEISGGLTIVFSLYKYQGKIKELLDNAEHLISRGKFILNDPSEVKENITFSLTEPHKGEVTFSLYFTSSKEDIKVIPIRVEENSFLDSIIDSYKDNWRPKYPIYTYDTAVPHLNTGDILLFHGIALHSKAIELSTGAYWSHSCMLIRSPPEAVKAAYNVPKLLEIARNHGTPIPDSPEHDLYVLESNYYTTDFRMGGGVQLLPFKSWLIHYENEYSRMHCVVRRLRFPLNEGRSFGSFPGLEEWLLECSQKQYECDFVQSVRAILKSNEGEDLSSVFCSELVAATLRKFGLWEGNASNITPKDFDKETYTNPTGPSDFCLQKGASLMDPIRIVFDLSKYKDKVVRSLKTSPPLTD